MINVVVRALSDRPLSLVSRRLLRVWLTWWWHVAIRRLLGHLTRIGRRVHGHLSRHTVWRLLRHLAGIGRRLLGILLHLHLDGDSDGDGRLNRLIVISRRCGLLLRCLVRAAFVRRIPIAAVVIAALCDVAHAEETQDGNDGAENDTEVRGLDVRVVVIPESLNPVV